MSESKEVTMKNLVVGFCLIAICAGAQQKPKSVLAQEGDYKVRQLVVPGFEQLPLQRKLFAYYLSMAGLAGGDIYWKQASREGLAIRNLFSELWKHKNLFTPDQKTNISEYIFRLYGNHSNYDDMGNYKFILNGFTKSEFLKLAQAVQKNARKTSQENISLVAEAQRLWRDVLDPQYKKAYMSNPPQDLIADTNSNFYGEGFSHEDFLKLTPEQQQDFLSYPKKGSVETARIGGRFNQELSAVDFYLSEAQKYANASEQRILHAYRKALYTGSTEDLRQAEALWVQYRPTDIEFQIGFIEVYEDPMKIRGSWEAFIFVLSKDEGTQKRVESIRNNASYFENNMPVDKRFKKAPGFTPPQAEGAFTLCGAGACGESLFLGVNLPNDEKISDLYGTKSFGNINVITDLNQPPTNTRAHLEKWLPKEYHPEIAKFDYSYYETVQIELHEILGHGSGQNIEGATDAMMKETYSSLEEMRAETASLYQLMDPKMVEFGVLPPMSAEDFESFRKLSLAMFFSEYIYKYNLLAEDATEITQAHRRAALVMLNYLMDKGVVDVQAIPGEYPHVVIKNTEGARKALGDLWSWIQTAKSTGDYELSKKLFAEYGSYADFHKTLRNLVKERVQAENIPSKSISLNPKLNLVRDRNGNIQDVKLGYHRVSQKEQTAVAGAVDKMFANSEQAQKLILRSEKSKKSCQRYFL